MIKSCKTCSFSKFFRDEWTICQQNPKTGDVKKRFTDVCGEWKGAAVTEIKPIPKIEPLEEIEYILPAPKKAKRGRKSSK